MTLLCPWKDTSAIQMFRMDTPYRLACVKNSSHSGSYSSWQQVNQSLRLGLPPPRIGKEMHSHLGEAIGVSSEYCYVSWRRIEIV